MSKQQQGGVCRARTLYTNSTNVALSTRATNLTTTIRFDVFNYVAFHVERLEDNRAGEA